MSSATPQIGGDEGVSGREAAAEPGWDLAAGRSDEWELE